MLKLSEKNEMKMIEKAIKDVLKEEGIDLSKIDITFNIGKYDTSKPNTIGCFREQINWYVYSTDDRLNITVNGPVSLNTAIAKCIRLLPIRIEKKDEYHYEKEDLEAMMRPYSSAQEAISNAKKK